MSIGSSTPASSASAVRKRVVERDVVRDQRAAAHQLDHVADDLAELRLVLQHLGGQAVDVGRARGRRPD